MKGMIPIMEPDLSGNEQKYLLDVIKSGWISSKGKYVEDFEENLADFHQVSHALAVSNGTVALHLGMVSLGIGLGDEVIVPNLTFASSVNTIIHAGATPVLVDVDLETYNIDICQIEAHITARTKAIMPVHLYGNPCNLEAIITIAEKHNLLIIEDNAEALGSTYQSKLTGTFGDVGTFSFYGNKTITTGEGGAILFKDSNTYEHAKILRDHGMSPDKRYWHDHIGFNYRLTNMQAALGCAQLERIDEILARKKQIAEKYANGLSKIESIKLQKTDAGAVNSQWLFTPTFTEVSSKELMNFLQDKGIETRPAFYPLSSMPIYSSYKDGEYSISEAISKNGLSLPTFPTLKNEEIDFIINAINEFYD